DFGVEGFLDLRLGLPPGLEVQPFERDLRALRGGEGQQRLLRPDVVEAGEGVALRPGQLQAEAGVPVEVAAHAVGAALLPDLAQLAPLDLEGEDAGVDLAEELEGGAGVERA